MQGEEPNRRGGYRHNAGRKSAHESGPKVSLGIKLSIPARDHLRDLAAERAVSLSSLIEALIERAWKKRKKEPPQ